ncbi:hypothetical protein G6011_08231 [Alternaria panax]|uniref:Uncharacterized protein n=1 Tax=Alternaria panax TaxID=48097 RepID=A0AAD4FJL1_9PLEO|nr:hypothetical protein G6011_08231 [Alternaria panax]
MPHSTHDDIYEPNAPENVPDTQESSSGSKWLSNVQKGKDHQRSHAFKALNPLDPYELGDTPIEQRQNAISSQHRVLELCSMYCSEATTSLENALQKYNYAHWICRQTGVWPGAQDVELVTAAQQALAKSPPPLSYDDFIQLLNDEGLTWLLEYVDQLDNKADFAVAPTADPTKKRCKVGRPRGKILKREQNDDLARRLCCLHKDEVGFRIQVERQNRDPWTCWPPNADEDENVNVE